MLAHSDMTTAEQPTYSLIIPVYNEEQMLPELYRQMQALLDRLDAPGEVILVDDGSRDRSYALLCDIHAQDARFKVVHFSRNFGKEIAVSAGFDLCTGQAIVLMDADLQDPPEVVLEMAAKWREGFDMVNARRERRERETWFKKATSNAFHHVLRGMTDVEVPQGVGDFRLLDRRALDAFKAMRERNRYVRGMFGWIGFKQATVSYVRPGRFAGDTKWPVSKLIALAVDGIISFSNVPLRLVLQLGFFVSVVSFCAGVAAIVIKLSGAYAISGWASLMVFISFLGGVQLTVLGVMGEYVGRIYDEVKQRPLYLVRNLHGFGAHDSAPSFLATRLAKSLPLE